MSRVPGCDALIGRHRHDLVFSSYGSRYPAALWLAIGLLVTPLPAASGQQAEPPPAGEQRWVERLSQRAVDRARELQEEGDSLAAPEGKLLEEIRTLERNRQIKTSGPTTIDGDLETIRAEHEETQASLVTIEKEIEEQRSLIEARLAAPRYAKRLLGADNLASLGRTYGLLGSLVQSDREHFEEHPRRMTKLRTAAGAALEQRREELAKRQQAAPQWRHALGDAIEAQPPLVEATDARRDLAAQLANELDAAHLKFNNLLTALTVNLTVHEGQVAFARPLEELGTLIVDHGDQSFSFLWLLEVAVYERGFVGRYPHGVGHGVVIADRRPRHSTLSPASTVARSIR